MKIVFDEWYGHLSYAQRAAYRKHNVSPSDHQALADHYGPDAHAEITAAVKRHSVDGMFRVFDFWREETR